MKLAETVTFGGSGLDRAAHLRGTDAGAPQSGDAAIVLWRGKVLMQRSAEQGLVRIGLPHPDCADARWIFLGHDADQKIFAFDISPWQPDSGPLPDKDVFFDPSEQQHPGFGPQAAFCELRGEMTVLTAREAELAATAKALLHWHNGHRFCARCGSASDMVMSGWQRSCSNCGAQHFPRTDPVVIMLITQGDNVLLGRSHHWPEGMYSLLAGFVEPGETFEAAVRREVMEESGIEVGAVRYLASQPWAFPNSLMVGCHGEALSTDIQIDPAELDDALWITKSDLMDTFVGLNTKIKPARAGSIAHFLLHNWLADRLD